MHNGHGASAVSDRETEREISRTSGSGGGGVQRRESTSSIWEVMGTRAAE